MCEMNFGKPFYEMNDVEKAMFVFWNGHPNLQGTHGLGDEIRRLHETWDKLPEGFKEAVKRKYDVRMVGKELLINLK